MPKYRITAPDGSTYEITAPEGATEQDVMSYAQSQYRANTPPAPQPKPEMSAGDVAGDVAKSAGIGLVQGGIGLATLPGNVEAIGRAGINAAAGLVGAQPPVSSETFLPTYSDWKGRVEGVTGEFYKPKTTLGEYARTAGEFAPLAIGGPASLGARAASVALPAVASETAGQVTKGTALEPWARAAGAFAGGMLPNTAARVVTPAPANAARQGAVQTLENEGVTALTAGQRTGNERLRWIEDATKMVPGGGGKATAMQDQAAKQFTAAALKKAGVQADNAGPDVINKAFDDLGNQFSALASRNDMVQSRGLVAGLQKVLDDYNAVTAEPLRTPIVGNVIKEFIGGSMAKGGAYIPGRVYQNVRSRLSAMIPELKAKDPSAMIAVRNIVDELDKAMEFSIRLNNPADVGAFRQVRGEYRNLLAIEDAVSGAGEAAAAGMITPAALRTAAKKQDKRGYVRGKGDLGPLARAGVEAGLTPLRSSGTAERNFAQHIISAPSAVGTGLGAFVSGADPYMMVAGAVAPHLIKAATARGLMSNRMQRYFANQRIPQYVEPMNAMAIAPFAAAQFEGADDGLRGGIGPRYDEYGNAMRRP
jgi:hypothetical protein